MAKKSDALRKKLAKSLAVPANSEGPMKPPPPPAADPPASRKHSVSLYPHDLSKADQVIDYLGRAGHKRVSLSKAVQVAVRAVKLDEGLIAAFDQITAADRRRRP
jgi:hypothetical protein